MSSRTNDDSLGLTAPAAVEVEVRSNARRVFRLSRAVGEASVVLESPAPFEPDQPVSVRFRLPEDRDVIVAQGEMRVLGESSEQEGERGGLAVRFGSIDPTARARLASYVRERLNLPPSR